MPTRPRKATRRRPDLWVRLGVEQLEPRWLPSVNVLTYHNDSARTGQNLNETTLTPANVNVRSFGKLFADAVDGQVYAQPLYMANLSIAGAVHNVVFVATQNDSVYAFDANQSGPPLWQVSLLGPGERALTSDDISPEYDDIVPQIGITGTPVIDDASGTLYVVTVATTAPEDQLADSSDTVQKLHALDITTGAEKFDGPVIIQASVNGTGDGNDGHGHVPFDPLQQLQRPGLLLSNGVVYIAWGSHADYDPYHGWIMGYDAATLDQVAVFNTTPNGGEGSIWQSGGGLATDDAGNIYAEVGNGSFDPNTPPGALPADADYGESILKLAVDPNSTPDNPNPNGWGLTVADFFTPYNEQFLNDQDLDIGSGGLMVLPDEMGSPDHPHLLLAGSKEGRVYLIDRDNMGRFDSTGDEVLQESDSGMIIGVFDTPALFNGTFYYVGAFYDAANAFSIEGGAFAGPISQSTDVFGYPGATPSISANGSTNGILWALDRGSNELRAYDATDLSNELYNSDQARNGRDQIGNVAKFTVPTVADGHVYVGTESELVVYGLRAQVSRDEPATPFSAGNSGPAGPAGAATAVGPTVPGVSTSFVGADGSLSRNVSDRAIATQLKWADGGGGKAVSASPTSPADTGQDSTGPQGQLTTGTSTGAAELIRATQGVAAPGASEFARRMRVRGLFPGRQATIQPVDLIYLHGLGQMAAAGLSVDVEALPGDRAGSTA
jgi:hypothetical protein